MGKVTDKGGAKMWRGTAVEDGFVAALRGGKEPLEVALRSYELNCAGELTDEIEEQRELIKPMLEQALIWQTPGRLDAAQLRVNVMYLKSSCPWLAIWIWASKASTWT